MSDIGPFADLSQDDFSEQYTGLKGPLAPPDSTLMVEMDDLVMEDAVDWVQQDAVNPIKIRVSMDQAQNSPLLAPWSLHTRSHQECLIPLLINKWMIAIRVPVVMFR